MNINEFSHLSLSEDALLNELTTEISGRLQNNNRVNLALAGGNTPKGLYEKLSHADLDWQKIGVTLTDERWVDVSDDESNEKMLKHVLLKNNAAAAQFLGLKNSQATPKLGESDTGALLTRDFTKLDYVILGMGDDGHFASIFPKMNNTATLLDTTQTPLCLATSPTGQTPRMSLTLPYLLTAQRIFLLISGQDKKTILHEQAHTQPSKLLPIHFLLHQTQCTVTIYWSEQ